MVCRFNLFKIDIERMVRRFSNLSRERTIKCIKTINGTIFKEGQVFTKKEFRCLINELSGVILQLSIRGCDIPMEYLDNFKLENGV